MEGGAAVAYKSVFARYESKYLLTREQYERIAAAVARHMMPDSYGRTTIRNVYFDTPDYRIIRRSMEKPVYKEKLRIRSYARVDADGEVFVELKKKYKGVVYKRRLAFPQQQALDWLAGGPPPGQDSQIRREIQWFAGFYGALRPTVYLCYDREAWFGEKGFRVTFDTNIRARQTDLTLAAPAGGTPILGEELVLMELKCGGGIPLWMTQLLTEEKIFKASFSKYGTAYAGLIYPEIEEEIYHV